MPEPTTALASATSPAPERGVWVHSDPDLGAMVTEGYNRALTGDWSSGTIARRMRAFRALLLERTYLIAHLAGVIKAEPSDSVGLRIDPQIRASVAPERKAAAQALYNTAYLLSRETWREPTEEGFATESTVDVAGWPLVVAVAVIAAGAIAYCAHQAAKVIDRQLARKADLAKLAQADAQTMQVVRAHVDRETKAGKRIPLDDASKRALEALSQRQQAIAQKVLPPMGRGIELPSIGKATAAAAGIGLGLLLGIAAAAYFITR